MADKTINIKEIIENNKEFINGLSAEDREKLNSCKSNEELTKLIEDYNGELPDDVVEAVAGGKGEHVCNYELILDVSLMHKAGKAFRFSIRHCRVCNFSYFFIDNNAVDWPLFEAGYVEAGGDKDAIQKYKPNYII